MAFLDKDWRRLPWKLRYEVLAGAASDARRLGALATHLHTDVRFDGPVYIGPGFGLRIRDRGTLHVGSGVEMRRDFVCEISGEGRVTIGDRCVFTGTALIQCTTTIDFEDGAVLGQGTMVADGNHRFKDPDVPPLQQGYDFRPIRIGRECIVHTGCTLVNSIGARAIIGANSVVTKPVPPYCLAVGAPARVIDYFGPPDRREEFLAGGATTLA